MQPTMWGWRSCQAGCLNTAVLCLKTAVLCTCLKTAMLCLKTAVLCLKTAMLCLKTAMLCLKTAVLCLNTAVLGTCLKTAVLCTCLIMVQGEQSDISNSSLSQTASYSSQCGGRLGGEVGGVAWQEETPSQCQRLRVWTINVPSDHGTVLHVRHVRMRNSSRFYVYSMAEDKLAGTWGEHERSFPVAIIRGEVRFAVETSDPEGKDDEWLSTFNVSYEVLPLHALPPRVQTEATESLVSSAVMFNCSARAVPRAVRCDMVQHCVGDEDEEGCEYRQRGCGTWVPYRRHCLKMEFARGFFAVTGGTYVTAPAEADKSCHRRHGAALAALPDAPALRLARGMMDAAGFPSVAVSLRKVKPVSAKHEFLYRYLWQWGPKGSPVDFLLEDVQKVGVRLDCAMLQTWPSVRFTPCRCSVPRSFPSGYICARPNPAVSVAKPRLTVRLADSGGAPRRVLTKPCADGSVVQTFHQCQWTGKALSPLWSPHGFSLFACRYGPPVHYSLLCDGTRDCADGSDEEGCLAPATLRRDRLFVCENLQVIAARRRCDGMQDCLDGTDEECTACTGPYCWGGGCVPRAYTRYFHFCTEIDRLHERIVVVLVPKSQTFPTVVLDGHGMARVQYLIHRPKGHFPCSNGMYVPTFLLNNGEQDCPDGEDEHVLPDNLTCPGYYRCQYSGNCVHPDLVCDGVPQCPNKDDERYCSLAHPANCTCEGYACSCPMLPPALRDWWYLRYLDLSGVKQPAISPIPAMDFLHFLNVSFCQLANLSFAQLPLLRVLDVSYNRLSGLWSLTLANLSRLTHLNLSGNPLVPHLQPAFSAHLARAGAISLRHLAMTRAHLTHIEGGSLASLGHLVSLDLRQNRLEVYDQGVFTGLSSLRALKTDDPRLCCPFFHQTMVDCEAPTDELSSCTDLLRVDFFRVFLWTVASLTVVGNSAVLLHKAAAGKAGPYHVLVTSLCVADLLMGVYMVIIGAADAHFRDSYVSSERQWRRSALCWAAGFVAMVSSEVSAFSISLITLDRLLTLCCPLKPHLHLTPAWAVRLVVGAWSLALLLATLPLVAGLEFYGESSICIPLPITRHRFSGQLYSFLVFIVLNFLLFVFIGAGQLAVYVAVQRTRSAAQGGSQAEASRLARRLFLVVFSDFCCWFPVGLLGLLAFARLPVPGAVSVWVAVFVLPLNSALNPFLYTLNSLREKWNTAQEKRQSRRILSNLKSEFPKLPPDAAEELMLLYLSSNRALRLDKVSTVLQHRLKHDNSIE
ncbi:hypothetical protein ACOMHN_060905 [Nucella lapillus]